MTNEQIEWLHDRLNSIDDGLSLHSRALAALLESGHTARGPKLPAVADQVTLTAAGVPPELHDQFSAEDTQRVRDVFSTAVEAHDRFIGSIVFDANWTIPGLDEATASSRQVPPTSSRARRTRWQAAALRGLTLSVAACASVILFRRLRARAATRYPLALSDSWQKFLCQPAERVAFLVSDWPASFFLQDTVDAEASDVPACESIA